MNMLFCGVYHTRTIIIIMSLFPVILRSLIELLLTLYVRISLLEGVEQFKYLYYAISCNRNDIWEKTVHNQDFKFESPFFRIFSWLTFNVVSVISSLKHPITDQIIWKKNFLNKNKSNPLLQIWRHHIILYVHQSFEKSKMKNIYLTQ